MRRSIIEEKNIDGSRLTFLRELYGYTLKDVANYLDVTPSYLSQLEKNKRKINFSFVMNASKFYNVPHIFLLSKENIPDTDGAIFFRKKAVVTRKSQKQAIQKARLYGYLEEKFSSYFRLDYFQFPKYSNENFNFKLTDYDYIDHVAHEIRKEFNLGIGPISNATLLVERLGIRVAFADLSSYGIDAVTVKINRHFIILLNSEITSSVRIRFNIIHELGHILLHSRYSTNDINNSNNHRRIESEADHFAGVLLMPEEGLAIDMQYTNMEYLKSLKKHWLVSLQALIYRGNEVGLISDQQSLYLRQTIARNHWRKEEPFDNFIPIERPSLLKSTLRFTKADKNNFFEKTSYQTGIVINDIIKILNLESDKSKTTNNLNFHIIK